MKQARPYTAGRQGQSARGEARTTLSHISRPYSAKNETLKRIIQVIQKTLSRGAQQALSRSSSKQKQQKAKRKTFQFTRWKMDLERSNRQRHTPKCKTQFSIATNTAPQSTPSSNRSCPNGLVSTCQFEDFVPYMQQQENIRDKQPPKKSPRPLIKKMTRRRTTIKDSEKENEKEPKKTAEESVIDKWQSDPPLDLSGLLDHQIR